MQRFPFRFTPEGRIIHKAAEIDNILNERKPAE